MSLIRTPRTKSVLVLGAFLMATATIAIAGQKAAPEVAGQKAILGQPFQIAAHKSVLISSEKLKLTFERVVEDSRCPQGVDCIWAGQATVTLRVEKTGGKVGKAESVNLTIQGSRYPTENSVRKVGKYWIKLVEVAPEKGPPQSPGTIERITLQVQKKPIATPKNTKPAEK